MTLVAHLRELAEFMYERTAGRVDSIELSSTAFDALARELDSEDQRIGLPRRVDDANHIELFCAYGPMKVTRGRESLTRSSSTPVRRAGVELRGATDCGQECWCCGAHNASNSAALRARARGCT